MLAELRLRLRILLRPRTALPVPVRLAQPGFVDFGGVIYQSFDEFVAALRRIRAKEARILPDPGADYDRVYEVVRAFQVAQAGTSLGFKANFRPDEPAESELD